MPLSFSDRRKPIPVSKFGEHVVQMHKERDKGFELEYNVCGLYFFTSMNGVFPFGLLPFGLLPFGLLLFYMSVGTNLVWACSMNK